ncbi:MAG: SLC13 family permease [Paracoccaceae bacterium]
MTTEAMYVFVLIAVAAGLMASNRVRYDFVALLVVIFLIVSDVLSVGEALAGFGSSVVIMVACLLVVGELLDKTGVALGVGNWILKRGGTSEPRLLILLMVSAAGLGSFMSSTAVVAIFIPIILRIAKNTGISQSNFLLPMAYAALISGMLTLIATPPNLVISDELAAHGFEPLGFFSFFPIGAVILVIAVIYILFVGRFLLRGKLSDVSPNSESDGRSVFDFWATFRSDEIVRVLKIPDRSKDFGGSVLDQDFQIKYGVKILARSRLKSKRPPNISIFTAETGLRSGDLIVVAGKIDMIQDLVSETGFIDQGLFSDNKSDWLGVLGAAVIMLHPEARSIGQPVSAATLQSKYGVEVLGLLRVDGSTGDLSETILQAGDRLLVIGNWANIEALSALNHELVVLELPDEHQDVVAVRGKVPVALAILAVMVVLSVFNIVPIVVAVMIAAIAAVSFGGLNAEATYRSLHWSSLILVAGMLPLADALEQTGGSQIIVDALLSVVGDAGPVTMMAAIFLLTAGLSLVLSNTASAVLVIPIAITAAETLGVSPYPMAISVLIAASAAFSTPISTPVVTLVVAPGGYKFSDFLKVGVPLTLLTGVATILVTPIFFPF